ncbi:hypothetical protein [Brevundimonas sp. LM2]|uniref:hypothetical protein n=1 Tax=Brevundimonas sp. LM2 TaxID=1938605 RepID=UPI0012375F10|nr:hypothetical protein [Brevundimonas sp. LM2]
MDIAPELLDDEPETAAPVDPPDIVPSEVLLADPALSAGAEATGAAGAIALPSAGAEAAASTPLSFAAGAASFALPQAASAKTATAVMVVIAIVFIKLSSIEEVSASDAATSS